MLIYELYSSVYFNDDGAARERRAQQSGDTAQDRRDQFKAHAARLRIRDRDRAVLRRVSRTHAEEKPHQIRRYYNTVNNLIYFDNAATTYPKPSSVYSAVDAYNRKRCGNPSRGAHKLALSAAEAVYKSREALAELYSASPENIAFTMNTTYALNFAIKSVIKPGNHVLISDMEHNSVLRPVHEACRRNGGSYDIFKTSGSVDDILDDIDKKRRQNTRLLVSTHQSNIVPLTLPVEEICRYCREHDIFTVIDCAQSGGTIPLNIEKSGVGAVCVPSHKGLYGIQGCGAIIFGEDYGDELLTSVEGGSGSESIPITMPAHLPDRFEAGTLPSPAVASIAYGIEFIQKRGMENIKEHEVDLCERIIKRLSANEEIVIYNRVPGQTLLFNINGVTPPQASSALDKYGICLRSGLHCSPLAHQTLGTFPDGALRASFGAFNTVAEADRFCDIVENIIKKRLF